MTENTAQVEEAGWVAQGERLFGLCCCYHPLIAALHDRLSGFIAQKVFICVSSVMTWARSKPLDPVSLPTHIVSE